jgi:hypothetical protein
MKDKKKIPSEKMRLKMQKKMNSRGNIWVYEFVIVIVLFVAVAMFFSTWGQALLDRLNPSMEHLNEDASKVGDGLLSAGIPNNWYGIINRSNNDSWNVTSDAYLRKAVLTIGITDNEGVTLNKSKLLRFGGWANSTYYAETKSKFGIRSNYLIFFENSRGEVIDFLPGSNFSGMFFGDMRLGADPIAHKRYTEGKAADTISSIDKLNGNLTKTNKVEHIVKMYRYVYYRESSRVRGELIRMAIYVW